MEERIEKDLFFRHFPYGIAFIQIEYRAFGIERYRLIDVNPTFCDMISLPAEEIRGKELLEIIPDIEGTVLQAIKATIITEKREFTETTSCLFKGHTSIEIFKIATDCCGVLVKERRERKISYSPCEKYEKFYSSIQDIILLVKRNGEIVEANKAAVKVYGYTEEELLKMNMHDLRTPEGINHVEEQMKYAEDSSIVFETIHKKKSGKTFPVEISARGAEMDGERVFFCVIRNITKRKVVEETLEKLSRALDQSPSAVIITDKNGIIEYVNKRFIKLTGYRFDEAIGKSYLILKAEEQAEEGYNEMKNNVVLGKEWRGEVQNRRKDGELYWASISITPFINRKGVFTHFISTHEDITENKLLIEKLKYTQMKLVQEEKMAGIGHLSAGVAHEVNNPLGFVTSNIETLKGYTLKFTHLLEQYRVIRKQIQDNHTELFSEIDDFEKENHIQYLLDDLPDLFQDTQYGLERITTIVKALQNFSRNELGESFEEYDLNLGIESILAISNNEIKYYAEVNFEKGDIPLIEAIGEQINQVLLAIIMNSAYAIKNMDNAEGRIKIYTGVSNGEVYCIIEDNGTGIPKENISKIFDPFFTTKPVGEGVGLGLSIAYDTIKNQHKGDISITSDEERGTTVKISLPIKQNSFYEEGLV